MKAIVQEGSGSADVLHLREIEKPSLTDDLVRVRVRAASLNALDWHIAHGGRALGIASFVMRSPTERVRGVDLSGEVEAVGKNVTRLRPGDEVFGTGRGALAEFALASEAKLAIKPPQLSFAHAATLGVAAVTALQGLRDKGQVRPGQRVVIYGAGGGVGTFAVQIAKTLGAHVTAVTGTNNLDVVRALAPDVLIDRTAEDFVRRGERYDVVFDNAADRPLSDYRPALTPGGRVVIVGASKRGGIWMMVRPLGAIVRSRLGSQWIVPFQAQITTEDLLALAALIEAGKLRPIIDREYPLSDAPEAIRYLGTGQARAKVVVKVS